MSTRNPRQLGPSLPFPERGDVTYTETIAANSRREGPRQAEEELVERGNLQGAFTQGVSSEGEQCYVAEVARGRSPLADGSSASYGPSFDVVPSSQLRPFWDVAAFGDPGKAEPFPYQPRAGYNRSTLAPLDGLHRGSQQNTRYAAKIAPENGGRSRRSIADVTEAL